MPKMQGVQRKEWANCDRCGFVHPIDMLAMQNGLRLCKCHGCYDDLTNDYRASVIAETLGDTSEMESDKSEAFQDPEELTF